MFGAHIERTYFEIVTQTLRDKYPFNCQMNTAQDQLVDLKMKLEFSIFYMYFVEEETKTIRNWGFNYILLIDHFGYSTVLDRLPPFQ